ncbi:MAG TPA: hypothetical protein VHX36_15490 [Candidatus Acidoferrales bacterium]|jgi:hypothetical protein|nr:hypothetical protein [Candidatus Acidoferrales bacterium]
MKAAPQLHYGRNFSAREFSTYDTGFAVSALRCMPLIQNALKMRQSLAHDLPSPASALATTSTNLGRAKSSALLNSFRSSRLRSKPAQSAVSQQSAVKPVILPARAERERPTLEESASEVQHST